MKYNKKEYIVRDYKCKKLVNICFIPFSGNGINICRNYELGKCPHIAVNFQFLYLKKYDNKNYKEFNSKKKTLREAMDDFLTRKKNLVDIDEEVEVTYHDGSKQYIRIDARQDWDDSWYFVLENQMICGNGFFSIVENKKR